MNRTNYIFVDFENVQLVEWDRVVGRPVHVTLVLGEQHKYFPVSVVKQMLSCATQVSLVETKRTGKNAADFILAELIGARSTTDPQGYFHVVSRDKGFEALIEHLRGKKILAARRESFAEIPVLMNAKERIAACEAFWADKTTGRPGKRSTMEAQIQALFARTLTAEEVDEIIADLTKRKIVAFDENGKVRYSK